jgi:hypothetical protein
MIDVFYIGQGERIPYYPIEVRNKDGAVDLSIIGVTAAYFRMTNISTASIIISTAANITDLTNGLAEYRWSVGDTDTPADYSALFLFVTPSGNFSLPKNEIAKIVVEGT